VGFSAQGSFVWTVNFFSRIDVTASNGTVADVIVGDKVHEPPSIGAHHNVLDASSNFGLFNAGALSVFCFFIVHSTS